MTLRVSAENQLHLDFVIAAANLRAGVFGIEGTRDVAAIKVSCICSVGREPCETCSGCPWGCDGTGVHTTEGCQDSSEGGGEDASGQLRILQVNEAEAQSDQSAPQDLDEAELNRVISQLPKPEDLKGGWEVRRMFLPTETSARRSQAEPDGVRKG